MRKKIILIATAFLIIPLLVVLIVIQKTLTHQTISSVIVLEATGFSPQQITIKQGDTIEFKTTQGKPFWPASDLHPTHGIYPEFDPQSPIDPDKSWSFTFKKIGSWRFHDHLNPFYRGTITVKI